MKGFVLQLFAYFSSLNVFSTLLELVLVPPPFPYDLYSLSRGRGGVLECQIMDAGAVSNSQSDPGTLTSEIGDCVCVPG
jgi:hypothetical protein